MLQGLEEINLKPSTQFKLCELAEKETERLIKKSEIEKNSQHIEVKLETLQECKYSVP